MKRIPKEHVKILDRYFEAVGLIEERVKPFLKEPFRVQIIYNNREEVKAKVITAQGDSFAIWVPKDDKV